MQFPKRAAFLSAVLRDGDEKRSLSRFVSGLCAEYSSLLSELWQRCSADCRARSVGVCISKFVTCPCLLSNLEARSVTLAVCIPTSIKLYSPLPYVNLLTSFHANAVLTAYIMALLFSCLIQLHPNITDTTFSVNYYM